MTRKRPSPEMIFYDSTRDLVKNLFTKQNPNFKSYYYTQQGAFKFQEEVERMAELLLNKMEDWKHLLNEE